MTHICVGKLTIVGSDNGLSPGRRQAIILTNAGILLIGPLGTNFSEILIATETFSFKTMHSKMSSAKWRLFGLGLNELKAMDQWVNGILLYFSNCVFDGLNKFNTNGKTASRRVCTILAYKRQILDCFAWFEWSYWTGPTICRPIFMLSYEFWLLPQRDVKVLAGIKLLSVKKVDI